MVYRADHSKDGKPWDANMILDDGGDLTAMYDKYPEMLDRILVLPKRPQPGHRLTKCWKTDAKGPAINVNDAVTKSKNDNKYGCRHSLNDAIKRGLDHLLAGKRALVLGYGDVGKGCTKPETRGHDCSSHRIDPICAMQACMDGYEVVSPFINGVNDGTDDCRQDAPREH